MRDLAEASGLAERQIAVWVKAARHAMLVEDLVRRIMALDGVAPGHGSAILCAVLESVGSGVPDLTWQGPLRAEAQAWAETASPAEIEVYAAVALEAIPSKVFAITARKRVLVWLWQNLDAADRAQFLARVDPTGKFRGAR